MPSLFIAVLRWRKVPALCRRRRAYRWQDQREYRWQSSEPVYMWMGVFCPEKIFEMDLEDKIKFWMTEGREKAQ